MNVPSVEPDVLVSGRAAVEMSRLLRALESYHALKFRHKRTARLGRRNHRVAKPFC